MQRVVMYGRLVNDITIRKTGTGLSVGNFRIAVDKNMKKGNDDVNFFNCTAWRNLADNIEKYSGRGCRIILEGEFNNENKKSRDGHEYISNEFTVSSAKFIDFKEARETNTWASEPTGNFVPETFVPKVEEGPSFNYGGETTFGTEDDEPILDITSDDLPF